VFVSILHGLPVVSIFSPQLLYCNVLVDPAVLHCSRYSCCSIAEATSALDTESERVVQNALDGLMELKSMTIFVIAHRLSTVRNADAIAVINDGQIVEMGTHDELLAKKCFYYDLVEAQHLRASVPEVDSEPPSEHEGRRESTVDPIIHAEMSGTPVIRFRDVHFRYPSRPNNIVFNGLNLAIQHGETLALCGPSGGGKSTTVALIECFYRPTEGSIEYNGVDMKEINIKWLRGSQIGLVSQEPVLFDTTILENIRFGTDATQEEVEDAARKANCHDFIVSFPEGYQTQVGQGSNLVSGGEYSSDADFIICFVARS
jgi:ATP-binding cassette subfamily B (MDR/TAP) protein 1